MLNIDFDALAVAMELPEFVVSDVAAFTWRIFGPAATAFEKLLNGALPQQMAYMNALVEKNMHPLARNLPLMRLSDAIFALVFYAVALIACLIIGKIVGKRKYRLFGLLHNSFLFALSLYMSTAIFVTAKASGFTLWNNAVGNGSGAHDARLARLMWLFYVSKLPEFADTFLMALKCNYRQISFLHLYHHSTIFAIWFAVVSVAPGGEAYWSSMVNSGIHVVMYGYYAGTLLGSEGGALRTFLNRFKFVITKGQMTQFALNLVQTIYDLFIIDNLLYPAFLVQILMVYMVSLLALFGNFLVKNSRGAGREGRSGAVKTRDPFHGDASPTPSPKPAGKRAAAKKE